MQGLLADVNVQGHLSYLRRLLVALDLWDLLAEQGLRLATFADLQLPRDLEDRALWNHCQEGGWVLLTENRNRDGHDSLQATLVDSWVEGDLPVLTLSNKQRFERDPDYARAVASAIADLLFGINQGECCHTPRIYVPRRSI